MNNHQPCPQSIAAPSPPHTFHFHLNYFYRLAAGHDHLDTQLLFLEMTTTWARLLLLAAAPIIISAFNFYAASMQRTNYNIGAHGALQSSTKLYLHDDNSEKKKKVMMRCNDFEALGLSDDLVTAAHEMNWCSPTPVQQLAIPAIFAMAQSESQGDNDNPNSLWCEAPTGSGKTGGFALPLLQMIMLQHKAQQKLELTKQRPKGGRRRLGRISSLILCPTRELAVQTGDVLRLLRSHLPNNSNSNIISIDVIHGGVPTQKQVTKLTEMYHSGHNVDILVATPGRLLDILRTGPQEHEELMLSSFERRIMDAFDGKSMNKIGTGDRIKKRRTDGRRGEEHENSTSSQHKGKRRITSTSLTLNDMREMDIVIESTRYGDNRRDAQYDKLMSTTYEMLQGLQYLVLDEADKLLGKAFQDEMDELMSFLPITASGDVQNTSQNQLTTMLFSATFPEQVEARADRILSKLSGGLKRPLRVSTSSSSKPLAHVPSTTSSGLTIESRSEKDGYESATSKPPSQFMTKKRSKIITPIQAVLPDKGPNIQHRAIRLNEGDRTQALRFLLEQRRFCNDSANETTEDVGLEWNRVLVFAATRYTTEHISRKLRRLGLSASELHGKLDQEAREQRLRAFRSGKTRILCATDLAARGVDIQGIDLVVNYDLPKSVVDYTHRIGRTGRAGKSGVAISFISGKSESHFSFLEKGILSADGTRWQKIEREVLSEFPPDEKIWKAEAAVSTISLPRVVHSEMGIEHDRTFGGVKGRRKSKKDKLREQIAGMLD